MAAPCHCLRRSPSAELSRPQSDATNASTAKVVAAGAICSLTDLDVLLIGLQPLQAFFDRRVIARQARLAERVHDQPGRVAIRALMTASVPRDSVFLASLKS